MLIAHSEMRLSSPNHPLADKFPEYLNAIIKAVSVATTSTGCVRYPVPLFVRSFQLPRADRVSRLRSTYTMPVIHHRPRVLSL